MYNREFFASKLGFAALLSIAAMISFNAFALNQQLGASPERMVSAAPQVELA